MLVKCNNL